MLRSLRASSQHLHLQKTFLLVIHQPLELLLHLYLITQLTGDLRVREKRGPHHFTRGDIRWIRLLVCLHHNFVVFEGTGLQFSYVNFPCFSALSAGIWLLWLAPAISWEYTSLREQFLRVSITRQHQLSKLVVHVHLFLDIILFGCFLWGRENAKEHRVDAWFAHILTFWVRSRQVLHILDLSWIQRSSTLHWLEHIYYSVDSVGIDSPLANQCSSINSSSFGVNLIDDFLLLIFPELCRFIPEMLLVQLMNDLRFSLLKNLLISKIIWDKRRRRNFSNVSIHRLTFLMSHCVSIGR